MADPSSTDYDECCDGSDEWVSGACPDKCAEIGKAYREKIESERKTRKTVSLQDTHPAVACIMLSSRAIDNRFNFVCYIPSKMTSNHKAITTLAAVTDAPQGAKIRGTYVKWAQSEKKRLLDEIERKKSEVRQKEQEVERAKSESGQY
jgi:protein kinase C substrate 80K-H